MDIAVPHLVRNNAVYYFRLTVPEDLRPWLGCVELKRSLKTSILEEAAAKCQKLTVRFRLLFEEIRMHPDSPAPTRSIAELVREIVAEHFKEMLEADERRRSRSPVLTEDEVAQEQAYCKKRIEDARARLIRNAPNDCMDPCELHLILSNHGLLDDQRFSDYGAMGNLALARAIVRADLEIAKIAEARSRGDYENSYDSAQFGATILPAAIQSTLEPQGAASSRPVPPPVAPPSATSLSLAEVQETYMKDRVGSGAWKNKSSGPVEQVFGYMNDVLGADTPINTITYKHLMDLRDNYLKRIPKNKEKYKRFKGKPLKDVVNMRDTTPIGYSTFRGYVNCLCTFFRWAQRRDYVVKSPAEGLLPKRAKRRASEERDPFSKDDLAKLLAALCEDKKQYTKRPERFWVPVIALLSGLRQGEICQLHTDDVEVIGGIPCFRVRDDQEDQTVKTEAGSRIVPVHSHLLDLGFMNYHKTTSRKQERLWPGLTKGRDGYGRAISRWFNAFIDTHVSTSPKLVFHSLRHNFTTGLQEAGIQIGVVKVLVGHHDEDVTSGRYTKYTPEYLRDSIEKLDLGIDLTTYDWPASWRKPGRRN